MLPHPNLGSQSIAHTLQQMALLSRSGCFGMEEPPDQGPVRSKTFLNSSFVPQVYVMLVVKLVPKNISRKLGNQLGWCDSKINNTPLLILPRVDTSIHPVQTCAF